MNDLATKRKIIEVANAEEPANSKKPKIECKEVGESVPDRSANFSSLPLEILSQHILRFFDFREWLELVIVCKQWQLAAQQSHLHKQLVYVKPGNLEATCAILRKYNVNTLVIVQETGSTLLSELRTLINSSPSITTLVLDQCYAFHNDIYSNMNQIKTLSTKTTWILPFFPNVEKFKLSKEVHYFFNSTTGTLFDLDSEILQDPNTRFTNVKEIEINVLPTVDVDFADITKYFPNLNKMYVNYGLKGNQQEVEEDWKELEEIGDTLGVQVICRNPHLSERSDVFSLKSIAYHEYFNAFGETPLQKFLSYNRTEKCQELFVSYSSRQYEKDLFHRQPQFSFPLRGPKFRPVGMMVYIGTLSDNTMLAMVECGYINYWKALRELKPERAVEYLNAANQYLPPTTNAIELMTKLIDQRRNVTDIAQMIGLKTFKEIAQLTSRHGSTLLHKLASKTGVRSDDLDLIIEHSDVHALNKEGMNAATIAFNHNKFTSWLKLVNAGSQVQTQFYGIKSSLWFLRELLTSDDNAFTKVLQQLDQPYLQKLMRLLASREATAHFFPTTQSEAILEDLISLGARPNDCDDQDPLISLMAESDQIKLFWPIIERYQLDIDAPNREGYTPLMISIQHGFFDQAELLLEEGADPNTNGTSNDGKVRHTVFLEQTVCNPGHYIELLKTFGADWTVEDEQGNTVLNYAMLHHNNVCIKNLAKLVPIDKPNHHNCTPLFSAIHQHKSGFVYELIEAGADPNALAGPLLQPALMRVIESSLEDTLLVLLKKHKNLDITTRDRVGRSIIHYLLLTYDIRLLGKLRDGQIALLIQRKALVLQSDYLQEDEIKSLVHKFSSPENITFVKNELATIFANPDLQHLKTNFLSIAITNVIITRTVVDMLGIDVNMEDSNGNTMLHLLDVDRPEAAVETPEDVVDYLLSKPSLNLNHQNKQKNTPLMTMTEKKKIDFEFETWQLKLIRAGASLTIKNMWGLSPIDIEPSLKQ